MSLPRSHAAELRPALLTLLYSALVASCTPGTFVIPLPSSTGTSDSPTTGVDASTTAGPLDTTTTGSTDGTTTGEASSSSSASTTDAVCDPEQAPEDWWDPAWGRRRLLQIDTTAFPGAVLDFPLLLRIPVDDLGPSWSERAGADLRFRSADQATVLDHDVDDEADGELAIWLRLPELDPTSPLSVWMYYDNPEAADGADPASVWASFISVHHLGSELRDSAGEHHGTSAWEPELCDGRCEPRIGLSRSFVPELLHEVVLDNHQDYDLGSDPYADTISFSISIWMRSSSFASYPWGAIVAKGDDTWRLHTTDLVDPLLDERIALGLDCLLPSCAGVVDALGNYNLIASSTMVEDNANDGVWHHVVATFEAVGIPELPPPNYMPDVQVRAYIDGTEVAASPLLTSFLVAADDQPVRLGHNINTANRWGGDLDELRISTGARTADEVMADYTTVTRDDLVQLGEEQAWCL